MITSKQAHKNAIQRAYYYRNREIILKKQKEYYQLHKEQSRKNGKLWKELNPEKYRDGIKKAKDKNRTDIRKKGREYYWANREARQVYRQEYYQKNKNKERYNSKKWNTAHPEKIAEYNHRRRARRKGAQQYALSAEQWVAVKTAYKNRCAYCNCESDSLTQDHVIALSRGGDHEIYNIVPACITCNKRKYSKMAPPGKAIIRLML